MKKKNTDENEYFDENISKSDVTNDKLYSPQAVAKTLMHFAGFDCTYLSFISPNDVLDYFINFIVDLQEDEPSPKKKRKITHKTITLGVGQCSNGKLLTTSCAHSYQIKPSKKEIKKQLLDHQIKEKFEIPNDKELNKSHYWKMIQLLKQFSTNKTLFPHESCTKDEIVKWLLDHLGSYISIIPDL